jgi:hypothetical protein
MSKKTETNVLLEVASLSMRQAKKFLERYSHRNSPQRLILSPLLKLLVYRAYLKTTYHGVIEFVDISEALKNRFGLQQLPHYSTLKKSQIVPSWWKSLTPC